MTTHLAVEIGGSKLQAALGDAAGMIHRAVRMEARPERGAGGIQEQVLELVRPLLGEVPAGPAPVTDIRSARTDESGEARGASFAAGPVSATIGFGGPVNAAAGRVLKSHQVGGWDDFPLAAWFESATDLPTRLGNDSDLAGLAEARLGAGRGRSPVVYTNVGSGIGGAIIIGGRLHAGQGLGSGEIGHLRVRPRHAASPTSGGRQPLVRRAAQVTTGSASDPPWLTVEDMCSGWSLARRFTEVAPASSDAVDAHSTAPFFAALTEGNKAAREIWSDAVQVFGVALANVIALIHPEVIVVGGGVAGVGDVLFAPLKAEVERQIFAPFAGRVEIVPAALGEHVVLHGALLLAGDNAD